MMAKSKANGEKPLISASTILILSGFLIGLTVGKIVNESLSPYVLSCGLAGFLAFIALELTSTQRQEQSAHEEQVHVQGRLDRHVLSLSSMSFTMPDEPSSPLSGATEKSSLNQSGAIDRRKLDLLYVQLMKVNETAESAESMPIGSIET